jgi:CheY-like chemotaxis protein
MPTLSIAVAADEPRMRDYYCSKLSLLGHRVVVAARDGREMVELCRNSRPDLIITDITMPEMDGIDAVHEISRGEPIPII